MNTETTSTDTIEQPLEKPLEKPVKEHVRNVPPTCSSNASSTKACTSSTAFPARRTSRLWRLWSVMDVFVSWLTRHEQGAGFMASAQGHLTGKPGVRLATLGPGALNLTLPVAQANASTTPLVAICAQGNVTRLYKESHQIVDLVSVFRPITQWTSMIATPVSVPEIIRKAFSVAQRKRPGATCLIPPEDVAEMPVPT